MWTECFTSLGFSSHNCFYPLASLLMTELCGYTNRSVLQGHTYCCYICFVAHSVTCI